MLCDNSDSPGYAEHHEVLFLFIFHKPYSVVAYVYDCYDTPRLSWRQDSDRFHEDALKQFHCQTLGCSSTRECTRWTSPATKDMRRSDIPLMSAFQTSEFGFFVAFTYLPISTTSSLWDCNSSTNSAWVFCLTLAHLGHPCPFNRLYGIGVHSQPQMSHFTAILDLFLSYVPSTVI